VTYDLQLEGRKNFVTHFLECSKRKNTKQKKSQGGCVERINMDGPQM
jgi:hypothetical protein